MKFILICTLFFFFHAQGQKLALVTSSKFSSELTQQIKSRVCQMYHFDIDSVGSFEPPDNGVESTTKALADLNLCAYRGTIGLTEKSMYCGMDFFPLEVYGYTHENECIVSDYLFGCCDPKHDRRMTNVVLHEVGHMIGLEHCKNSYCLMFPGGHVDNERLCSSCKQKLNKVL